MLADLESGALTRIMRPTVLFALVAGAFAVGAALLLSAPLAAVGIVVGVGVAILNVRMLGSSVVKVQAGVAGGAAGTTDDQVGDEVGGTASADAADAAKVAYAEDEAKAENKVVRRLLRTNSAVRLVVITLLAIGLVLVAPPLGIGMVVGLVIFQISFVLNAGRAILSAGIV
jgi:hypothetical protein